jgi:hypothetical protein
VHVETAPPRGRELAERQPVVREPSPREAMAASPEVEEPRREAPPVGTAAARPALGAYLRAELRRVAREGCQAAVPAQARELGARLAPAEPQAGAERRLAEAAQGGPAAQGEEP